MCPPAASPIDDIDLYCCDKDIVTSLDRIISGSPLPSNVLSDVNPYQYRPSDLPPGFWFFLNSKMRKHADFGCWRTKGEACQIFSNSSITGWRSTLEFFDGQAPRWRKTDWVMQEYRITRKKLSKDSNEKETSLLCNVFFVGEQNPNHEKPQKMAQGDTANQPTQSIVQKAENHTEQGAPAASPIDNIDLYCSDKDIVASLDRIISGSPLPSNMLSDVNPYQYKPSDLPPGFWFFINSKMRKDADFGCWRAKGEACQIFSNSSITGWRSTLEFFDGQAPRWRKTDWVMQEYWITRKILSEDSNEKATSLLCNVFFVGEQNPNHVKPRKMAQCDTANQPTQSVVQKAENRTEQGSTSKRQKHQGDGLQFIAAHEDNETGRVRNRERVPDDLVDSVHETDYLPGGNYLELRDLEIPASPSSSSDSSCLTMSSDECFDVLDLLQDLEAEKSKEPVQNNPGCKLSVFASSRPTEMVMYPAFTGTLDKSPNEELLTSNRSLPGSTIGIIISDKKVLKNPDRNQKPDFRNEGAPSTSQNRIMSLNGNMEAPEEERKAACGRMKKLKNKYLCFMPFLGLF